jgi:hypothetical protein
VGAFAQEVIERPQVQLVGVDEPFQPAIGSPCVPALLADELRSGRLLRNHLLKTGQARNQLGASDLAKTVSVHPQLATVGDIFERLRKCCY